MRVKDAVRLAVERARQLRVDPQFTVSEAYEAEFLRRLQPRVRSNVVWKGGTVLRLEGSERFSRDLDATRRTTALTIQRLTQILTDAGKELAYLTDFQISAPPPSIVALYRLSVPDMRQPLRIRIEISRREKVLRPPIPVSTARIAHPVGLEPVIVARLEPAELLAEKVLALVVRLAGRDIYDVYWLLQRGVEFDWRLFVRKMSYYKKAGSPIDPAAAIERAVRELEDYNPGHGRTELANLFPAAQRSLDFTVIVQDVVRALKRWSSQLDDNRS